MGCSRFCYEYIAFILLVCFGWPMCAERPDVVVMNNGDHFSCTVKKLEQGVLYIDTDYIDGSTGLDWAQVQKVESKSAFQVTLADGTRSIGVIQRTDSRESGEEFVIASAGIEKRAKPAEVVNIESQKSNFWQQLTGEIDVGYDFTSGNSQTSLTSDANVKYETTGWLAAITDTTSFSGESGASRSNLIDLQGSRSFSLSATGRSLGCKTSSIARNRAWIFELRWAEVSALSFSNEHVAFLSRWHRLHPRELRAPGSARLRSEH